VEERKNQQSQQEISLRKLQKEGDMAEEAFKGKTREEADLVKAGRLA